VVADLDCIPVKKKKTGSGKTSNHTGGCVLFDQPSWRTLFIFKECIMKAKLLVFSLVALIALGVMLPALADVTTKDHMVHMEHSWMVESPCVSEGIAITSFWNYNYSIRTDKSGVLHVKAHINEQGSTAIGMVTGIKFNVTGNDQDHAYEFYTQDNKVVVKDNFIEVLGFTSPGKDYNFKVFTRLIYNGIFDLVINDWVTLEVKHEVVRIECN